MAKRFLFTVVRKSDLVPETMESIFRIFAWSMNALLSGHAPLRDWADRPRGDGGRILADGLRGALCQVRGDWAFYCEVFGFPQWNSAVEMCWMCKASSTIPHLAFTDFRPNAGWRSTLYTHDSWILHRRGSGLFISVLLTMITGMRLECVMVDVLHTVDQGITSHILGNIFWIFVVMRSVFGGNTQVEKVKFLWEDIKKWYSRTKIKARLQGSLTVERLRSAAGWPKLKSKAAGARHLAKYAFELVLKYKDDSAEDNKILGVIQLRCRFYDILNEGSQFLSDSMKAEISKVGTNIGILYSDLSAAALVAKRKLWKGSPKLHIFVHLCEIQAQV
jgi:hypothetical protein